MRRQLFILIIFFLFHILSSGQSTYTGKSLVDRKISNKILVDSINKIKFILDSTQTRITALNFQDKILWSTDPWLDNKISEYRTKRPRIVYFELGKNNRHYSDWDKIKDIIDISYNNSQFGVLDRKTGKFLLLGQD